MEKRYKEFLENIIKWYEIDKNQEVYLLSYEESFEEILRHKGIKIVKEDKNKYKDDSNYKKFDYIIIYGFEKILNLDLKVLIEHNLKDEGKIIIIGLNDYAINNWSKYKKENTNCGILKIENNKDKNSQINLIKEELKENGIDSINTFYVFPNYENAELIMNEKLEIRGNYFEKYTPDLNAEEIKIFDEQKVIKSIIESNPTEIEFFANSYFIEASKSKIENDIKYISYNNVRKTKYRLITIMKENVVEKLPENEEAVEHINNIKDNIKKFNSKIELLDYEENGKICSKLIKNEKTLDEIIYEKCNNIDDVIDILEDYRKVLMIDAENYNENIFEILPTEMKKYGKILEELHYLKNSFWDMIPKNCFYINNKYVFFDQEWKKEYLPVEFILYRSIINSYDLVRNVNVNEIYQKLNIEKYIKLFEDIDLSIKKEIIDIELYNSINKNREIKAIDNLINENIIYAKNNEEQKEYIKKLEETLESVRNDNEEKQKYIEHLEKNQRKFFKRK